jgi:hypothetical protein
MPRERFDGGGLSRLAAHRAGAQLADNVPDEVMRLKEIVAEGLSQ